ncbi:type II secretion system F family protein [Cocleimonas flava]
MIPLLVTVTVVILGLITFSIIQNAYAEYKNSFHTSIQKNMIEMFLFIPPEKMFILSIVLILAVFYLTYLITGAYILALTLAFIAVAVPRIAIHLMRKKRIKMLTSQLPDFLMSVSRAMQAGSSLSQSLEVAIQEDSGPVSQEFALVMKEVRLGVDFNESLDNFSKRVPIEEANLVANAIKISREIGGNLSEAIYRLSVTLRTKLETEGKIDALTAQGRLQGIVMTLLPIFLGFVIYKMEPEAMSKMIEEPIGWLVMAIIVVMELLGYFFIRKIVNIDV